MAYVAPTTRSDGYVVPAATWNQDVVENVKYFKDAPSMTTSVTAPAIVGSTSVTAATAMGLTATGKLYLDGVAMTGDTYIQESAANVLALVSGGSAINITSGVMTKPVQPAFQAQAALQSNITGDGTTYTVLFATEIFDQANNFASPTFTAPVTGRYLLNVMVSFSGLTASHTNAYIVLVTSNRSYTFQWQAAAQIANDTYAMSFSVLADMDAADTASVQLVVSGGTKVVDIVAGGGTTFSGYLAC